MSDDSGSDSECNDQIFVSDSTRKVFTPDEVKTAREHYNSSVRTCRNIDFAAFITYEWGANPDTPSIEKSETPEIDQLNDKDRDSSVPAIHTKSPQLISSSAPSSFLLAKSLVSSFASPSSEPTPGPSSSSLTSSSSPELWATSLTEAQVKDAAKTFFVFCSRPDQVKETFEKDKLEASRIVDRFLAFVENKTESEFFFHELLQGECSTERIRNAVTSSARRLAAASARDPVAMTICVNQAIARWRSVRPLSRCLGQCFGSVSVDGLAHDRLRIMG